MRITLNYVNKYLLTELVKTEAIVDIKDNSFDIILVELASGEIVAIHLVERDIDLTVIKNVLTQNTKSNYSTLFILWAAMLLPEHGELYPPYEWMSALMSLYDDKIYAYEMIGSEIYIFPVHFDRQPVGIKRLIRYGDRVEMANLSSEIIHTEAYLQGFWRIADFERRSSETSHQRTSEPDQQDGSHRPLAADRNPVMAYYEILGVNLDADGETVRKAYHELALLYHPDLNKTPEATARMQEINTAYARIMERLGLN